MRNSDSTFNYKNAYFNVIKIVALSFLLIASFLFSCSRSSYIENELDLSYIPEAANQFAYDKETEVETIEPTKAQRNWPSNFRLNPSSEIVIGEKQFLTKIHHIHKNIDLYQDSTIIVEGMYGKYRSWDGTFESPIVFRNGPAEHGDDQYGGFFLANIDESAYDINDWLKVTGKPFIRENTDSEGEIQHFLFINVEKIEVLGLKERKAEMVND